MTYCPRKIVIGDIYLKRIDTSDVTIDEIPMFSPEGQEVDEIIKFDDEDSNDRG